MLRVFQTPVKGKRKTLDEIEAEMLAMLEEFRAFRRDIEAEVDPPLQQQAADYLALFLPRLQALRGAGEVRESRQAFLRQHIEHKQMQREAMNKTKHLPAVRKLYGGLADELSWLDNTLSRQVVPSAMSLIEQEGRRVGIPQEIFNAIADHFNRST